MTKQVSHAVQWITPDWPAPAGVRALTSLRGGGVSRGTYAGLNLALHVGDDPEAVRENRDRLLRAAGVPVEPCWLEQVHGTNVIDADDWQPGVQADAAVARYPDLVCAVLTADCLPVLLCARDGSAVAAIHAGWRGLAAGVIEATAGELGDGGYIAWLGPAIGPQSFEVGDEVRAAFLAADAGAAAAFRPSPAGRWLADLCQLARRRLQTVGITEVYGGGECTHRDAVRFYSYRRDGETGRMASLIWREGA
ncbi:MAG: peptidoglycan editing factor PgeF [Gammaproteobacteria bacterium]|nr:peptidoglycan editing factor PgeF [Gammaproteobacteria bacterium]